MTLWQHILVAALIPIVILLGGAILLFLLEQPVFAVLLPIPVAAICLFALMKLVPARCPDCGGKAYLRKAREKGFYYECAECGVLDKVECSLDE